jgi:hypothetical protein
MHTRLTPPRFRCKAAKPNKFGKVVKLQEAENQIVIDYEVYYRRTC